MGKVPHWSQLERLLWPNLQRKRWPYSSLEETEDAEIPTSLCASWQCSSEWRQKLSDGPFSQYDMSCFHFVNSPSARTPTLPSARMLVSLRHISTQYMHSEGTRSIYVKVWGMLQAEDAISLVATLFCGSDSPSCLPCSSQIHHFSSNEASCTFTPA